QDYAKLTANGGAWKAVADPGVPNPVDSADTLLTVHSDLASKLGLAKEISSTPESLASERHYNIVATLDPGAGEQFVEWLSSSAIRAILLVIFLQSLYLAFHIPG